MAKIRIHELAKEINKDSKEIIRVLTENKIEAKSHMSTISDEEITLIKKNLMPPQQEEKPKEKKITRVYHPQNSGMNKNQNKGYQSDRKPQGGSQNDSRNQTGQSPKTEQPAAGQQTQQQRPAGQYTQQQRPAGQSQQQRPAGQQTQQQRPAGQQSQQQRPTGQQSQQQRPTGQQRPASQQRPTGQTQQQRPSGQPARTQQSAVKPDDQKKTYTDRKHSNKPVEKSVSEDRNTNVKKPADKRTQSQQAPAKPQANKPNQGNRPNQGKRPNQGNRYNQGGRRPSSAPVAEKPKEETIKTIILPEALTIKELADKLKINPSALVKKLFLQGQVVTINQEIDFELAEEIAMEYNVICEKEVKIDVIEELLKEEEEDESTLKPRPPVICVMGHVDHGKTSLLDAIRKSNVISGEAGGITQHIGAYVVEINGEKITFLDTPGHEAFTSMRMRGASSTDIAILVVAADDGVMPQTVEAINHAKAAKIPIIVAINKIDKPSANIERVKQELTEYELVPEDWGGDTIFVPVSAHTKEGIASLLEMILLTAEVSELKENPDRKARGLVIEARLDKGKGPIATLLVQKGTLKVGDHIAVGSFYGKVRAMTDDKGRRIKSAGPSTPVEILGLDGVPNAGDIFVATDNDKEARNFAETFISEGRERLIEQTKAKLSLDDLFSQIQAGDVKELNIIIKGDVQGSVEALKQSLLKLSNDEVMVKVIHSGVGAVNESDVILASASNAIILGFNVRPDHTAKEVADKEKVDIRLYRVIYSALDDVEAAMKGMLDPIFREKVIGHALVRQTFKASGVGTIAGAYVTDGILKRDCTVRLLRDNVIVYEGKLASLKRFKDDVKEVRDGYEFGFVLEKYNDIREDDQVEAYEMEEVPR